MPAPDQPTTELILPAFDVGVLARRVGLAALLAAAVVVAVVLGGGRIHAFADALQRGFDATPGWVAVGLALAFRRRGELDDDTGRECGRRDRYARLRHSGALIGRAVRDALGLVRSGDSRLAGAVAYWMFDAAVLWSMLHAFGSPPALSVIAVAYLVGQVANTLPIPGSVSGGMAGVLI